MTTFRSPNTPAPTPDMAGQDAAARTTSYENTFGFAALYKRGEDQQTAHVPMGTDGKMPMPALIPNY